MNPSSWDDRIKRAEELAESHPFARDFLIFYREILFFQKKTYNHLSEALSKQDIDCSRICPLHDSSLTLHLPLLLTGFPSFLSLIRKVGPGDLSRLADKLLTQASQADWGRLLESYWRKELNREALQEELALLFFPKAFLQPYAELLADHHPELSNEFGQAWEVEEGGNALCPLCGSRPQLGILRAEAEGAKRSLLCSLCSNEWRYKRICCSACGEEQFSKLSYPRASEFPYVQMEVCESCHKYIKEIDFSINGLAVPVVDEIATLPLDLWAAEQGYEKIEMNLVGI